MKTRALFAFFVIALARASLAQSPPEVDMKVIREFLDRVRATYDSVDAGSYTVMLRSSELEAAVAAKLAGLPISPGFRLIRLNGKSDVKASIPELPEPFRTKAENKINDAIGSQEALRLLRDINGGFIGSFLRSAGSGEFDLIRCDDERIVLEFNELSEPFYGNTLLTARFFFDRRSAIVYHLQFTFSRGHFLDARVEYSTDQFIPGTKMPLFLRMDARQSGFNAPLQFSMRFENYQFHTVSPEPNAGKLAAWKAGLIKAGMPEWRADRLTQAADGKLRLDLRGAPLTDLSMLRGLPLNSLDISETKVASLDALHGLPLEHLSLDKTLVTDLSPLKGAKLVTLSLRDVNVRDLSALAGMPLAMLDLQGTPGFESLAPLAGMPLKSLSIENFPVADLSPLKGMPLRELNASGTKISDLTPLAGMPLRKLLAARTQVRDLAPLAGMPLEAIDLGDCKEVRVLAPLAGMPLRKLLLARTSVSDIAPLAGSPLEELDLAYCGAVRDINPLAGMPLRILHLTQNHNVEDLTPLRSAKLEMLNISNSRVTDLSPVAGMPLRFLNIGQTPVSDLGSLAGIPLKELVIERCTHVRDLRVLAGMKLESLNMDCVPAGDISMLKGMPLRQLNIGKLPISDLGILAGMPLKELKLAACPNIRDLSPLSEMAITDLHLGYCEVEDLTPLKRLPLRKLMLHGSKATDLRPLAECRDLESITIPLAATHVETLRTLPKLKQITASDTMPRAEQAASVFWEKYDARK